jgi:hypothetical protein
MWVIGVIIIVHRKYSARLDIDVFVSVNCHIA